MQRAAVELGLVRTSIRLAARLRLAEVLKLLRNFKSDPQSALDAIAAKALDLCGALPVVCLRWMLS